MAERLTIIEFVEKYVAKFSQRPFLWEKNLDTNEWEPTTYEQTLAKAKRIAAGLMALGVQKGEKISYLSEGRDMWVIGELGVLCAESPGERLMIYEACERRVSLLTHSGTPGGGFVILRHGAVIYGFFPEPESAREYILGIIK